ncbi:RagB/SusD family nutrient uptake outer membrane protein [Bacteroides thetaiotaomicron]|uniref:RagB/SusD family nutrient uptake outer membrane protein n=1 Tax=Bacteroides thetaiotaomicron TaxID=818 RepID=UPI002166BF1C|nr:RagB/SusD family nutrient uptake outer membrane protein [Bacteroides thetaiotaomicron]MCS2621060.1 RagB/SusD family nutrient uptake outer membrane protein [Bacteroides thetaiotaomicron]
MRTVSGFRITSGILTYAEGTTATPPYDKLEPRFKATILYNGATWHGRSIASYVNGTDGWAAWKTDAKPEGRSTTGYYLRKLVDETHSFTSRQASTQP